MKSTMLISLLLAFTSTAMGQTSSPQPVGPPQPPTPAATTASVKSMAEPPRQPDVIVPVEPPTARMTNRIAFVVDSSGSMDNQRRMTMAITFARNILQMPTDDMEIALFSFKDSHTRWPGVPHDGKGKAPPGGWTQFPGRPQMEGAQQWLTDQGASGGTNPTSAITDALDEPVEELTLVLITDGEFNNVHGLPGEQMFLQAIQTGQAARIAKKLPRAVIIVIGIGSNAETKAHLRNVGKAEGGGFYVVKPAAVVAVEERERQSSAKTAPTTSPRTPGANSNPPSPAGKRKP